MTYEHYVAAKIFAAAVVCLIDDNLDVCDRRVKQIARVAMLAASDLATAMDTVASQRFLDYRLDDALRAAEVRAAARRTEKPGK